MRMTDHVALIAKRGGIRPLARALGHRNHTTVQGWWERKRIPDEHISAVSAVCEFPEQANAA